MAEDNLKKVWQTLYNDNYDVPDYDTFKGDMEDDDNLRGVWETMGKRYDLPDYDQFKSDMGFGGVDNATDETDITGATAVDKLQEQMSQKTGRMPEPIVDQSFNNAYNGWREQREKMMQVPQPDHEPWKAEGLTKEQWEDAIYTQQANRPTRLAVDEEGRVRANAKPGEGVAESEPQRTYQTKESWDDQYSRKPSKYGELRYGWRRGDRVRRLNMDGMYLAGYVGSTNQDALAEAEGMSDEQLVSAFNRLSDEVKKYNGGYKTLKDLPEGQQMAGQLNAIMKELHARDLGFAHDSEWSRGEADYRSVRSDKVIAEEMDRMAGMDVTTRQNELADMYLAGMESGNMENVERALLASAALRCRETGEDIDTAYAKVEADAFNRGVRDRLASEVDAIYDEEKGKQQATQDEAANASLMGNDPSRSLVDALAYEYKTRKAAPTKEMLNAMARRAANESPAARAYYQMQLREYMRGGQMDIMHARAAAMNDVRNLFRDREVARQTPGGDWGYVGGSALLENLPIQAMRGVMNLATGDYEYDQVVDDAYARYGAEKASTAARIGASVAPFIVDTAVGTFEVPGLVAKTGQQFLTKGLVWAGKRSLGVAEETLMKRLGGNLLYRGVMGSLGGGLNFMTYNAMSAAVQGFRQGNASLRDIASGAKRGLGDGVIFGGVNGLAGKVTDVAKGMWAIPAETGVLAVEGGVFTALDYLHTGEITPESIGSSFGMAIAGRVTNFKRWAGDMAARIDGTKWQNTVEGPVRLSKETRRELEDRYPTICRLMSDGALAKDLAKGLRPNDYKYNEKGEVDAVATANAIEQEWDAMQNDTSVPYAVRRMVNYALNGKVVPKPAVCNFRVGDVDENGVSWGETLDIDGNVIERFKLKDQKARMEFEQGVALDAERNRIGIEYSAYRAREIDPVIAEAVQAVAGERGIDPNELIAAYFTPDENIKGKAMKDAVHEAADLVMAEMSTKTNIEKAVQDKYGVDLAEALKTPIHERTEAELQAIEEYEQRLRGDYDESQDMSSAELVVKEQQESHDDGYQAQGEQLAEIKERLEDASQALYEMRIDPRRFDNMNEQQISDWLESRGNNEEETDAVLEYLNAKAALEGVQDKVQDDTQARIEEVNKQTDERTNKDTGLIHPVVMNDDKEAFVVSGRVETHTDGTVDTAKSDDAIVVLDPETGEPKMVSPKDVKSAGETMDPEQMKQESAEQITQEVAGEVVRQMNRDLPFNQGDTYDVLVEGRPERVTVVGLDENGDPIVVDSKGRPIRQDENGNPLSVPRAFIQDIADAHREWVKNGASAMDNGKGKMGNESTPAPTEEPVQSAGPQDKPEPVDEPKQEQVDGEKFTMPVDGEGEPMWEQSTPEQGYEHLKSLGLEDADIDRIIEKHLKDAVDALDKAREGGKVNEITRARENAKYWDIMDDLRRADRGEVVIPQAENEMKPVEEPSQEEVRQGIDGIENQPEEAPAEEYNGLGMSDELREKYDDGTGVVDLVDNIARQLGFQIREYDGPKGIPGETDFDNRIIYINRDRSGGDSVRFTLGHEITHGLKAEAERLDHPELYEALRDAALNVVKMREGSGYEAFVKQRMKDYRNAHYQDGYNKAIAEGRSVVEAVEAGTRESQRVTRDFIEEELVCDTIGEIVSGNAESARSMMQQVENRSALQRFRDYIVDLLTKVRDRFTKGTKEYNQYDDTITKFNEMYNEVMKERMDIQEGLDSTIEDSHGGKVGKRASVTANFEGLGFKVFETDANGEPKAMEDEEGNFCVTLGDRRFNKDNHITVEDIAGADSALNYALTDALERGKISPIQQYRLQSNYAKLLNLFLDLGAGEKGGVANLESNYQMLASTVFRAIAPNGDKQYGVSNDITRICKKNEAVINTISQLQLEQGYGATPAQILDIYLSTHEEGYQVPCPVCYVFSRYIRNGKFASSAINGMEMYGDHLPGGSDPWTVEQWVEQLGKLGGLEDVDADKGVQMFEDLSSVANDAITRNLTLIDQLGAQLATELNKAKPDKKYVRQLEKDIKKLSDEYKAAIDYFGQMSQTNWIKNFAIRKVGGEWRMWEDAHVPEDMEAFRANALDLRRTAETIVDYPAIQRLRRSGGSASGKEIHQESNNEVGEVIMGIGQKGVAQYENYYRKAQEATDPMEKQALLDKAREKFDAAVDFAKKQNLRGGQRMWSWSDNIERLGPDVISNLMQLEMIGSGLQSYSKQLEGVEMVARMNGYVNGSLMAKDDGYREVSLDDCYQDDAGVWRLKEGIKDTVYDTWHKKDRERLLADAGAMVHEVDGKYYVLTYDDVLGIDPFGYGGKTGLFELNKKYDRAGNILVGMNDMHCRLALADDNIFFIIPWHASGANNHILSQMLEMLGQDINVKPVDYTSMQEEKDHGKPNKEGKTPNIPAHLHEVWNRAKAHAEEKGWTSGIGDIDNRGSKLTKSQEKYRELRDKIMDGAELSKKEYNAIMADEFLRQVYEAVQEAGGKMTSDDKGYIYPYEYWDKSLNIDKAEENGWRYMEYCRRLGRRPKFSGKYGKGDNWTREGDFTDSPGYWKTLIDRRMYDTEGRYQEMDAIDSSGFDTELVDIRSIREKYNETRVADAEGVNKIVQNVKAKQEARTGEYEYPYGMGQGEAAKRLAKVKLTTAEKNAMVKEFQAAGKKKFSVPETTVDDSEGSDAGVRFSIVRDPVEREFIDRELERDKEEYGDYIVRYRAMALFDDGYHQPMASKEDGLLREALHDGDIERSDELDIDAYITPEIRRQMDDLEKNGKKDDYVDIIPDKVRYYYGKKKCRMKFHLVKPNGDDLWASYNPYLHMSDTPLNDQFKSAWERPELVVVRVLVPRVGIERGNPAKYAKDDVGETPWKSGSVNGALPKEKQRTVTLSRYAKIDGIVPVEEAVAMYADKLLEHDVTVPFNTVTPAERDALHAMGVKIGPPERNMGEACTKAYEQWKSEHPEPGGGKRVESEKDDKKQGQTIKSALGRHSSGNNAPWLATSPAKLGNADEITKKLDGVLSNINDNGSIGSHELLFEIAKSFGYNNPNLNHSTYYDLGNGIQLRIADHYGNAEFFKRHGHEKDNYGIVIKLSSQRFRPNENVDYLECVYYPDRIADTKSQQELIEGLKRFAQTGDFTEMPLPNRINPSGKWEGINEAINKADNTEGTDITDSASGKRFSVGETSRDEDGNEIYTETREDGTLDRMITTFGDGSKRALWYDEKGNVEERLDYYPNGEVKQVANYDSDGNLTRQIQYDENMHTIRHYEPAIGTDWERDENGVARGMSNGVEMRPYGSRFSVEDSVRRAEEETETELSDAQKEAGNYRKGHVKIDGFDISIEQPRGSVRSGVDASGKQWSQEMHNTYGYIRGTEGVDGDHIDVFLSDHPGEGNVYVVDQVNKDGSFDEHKVMYGFNSAEEARKAYLSNYEEGWTGLGAITPVSKEEFKKWVDSSHRKTKPFAEYSNIDKEEPMKAGDIRFQVSDVDSWEPEQVSWERAMLDHVLANAGRDEAKNQERKAAMHAVDTTLRGLFDRMQDYRLRDVDFDVANAEVSAGVQRATKSAGRAQRGYDRYTVDSLVSMAKSMLKSGMYKELRPYEVQRLINKINEGAGRREIQEQMNTVFDVLMKANLRGWSEQLNKLISTPTMRISDQGLRVMGRVDREGGIMLRALRDGMEMTPEELEQRIAEVSDRMGSDNSIDADNAEIEYEGLFMAQQYIDLIGKYEADNKDIKRQIREQQEKIYDFLRKDLIGDDGEPVFNKITGAKRTVEKKRLKPEYGGLDEDGNRSPMTEEAKALRKQVETNIANLENSMRENWVRMSEGYNRITDDLGGGVAAAVTRAKEWRDNEKERKQAIYHAANSDMMNVSNLTQQMDRSKESSFANSNPARFFLGPLATFENLFRYFGQRSAYGEGRMFNMFVRPYMEHSHNEWKHKKEGIDEMDQKAQELFGYDWIRLGEKMRDGDKFPPVKVSYWDSNQYVDDELRQDEAVYIYCVNKMRDGKMKLEAMGIDDGMVQQVVNQLDPRLVQLADWYQNEFLPKRRNRYNEVYERMFGVPMARVDNYIHLNINPADVSQKMEIGDRAMGGETLPSTVTGSLKERKTNTRPIRLRTSLIDLAMDEHNKMEHWAEWAEYCRDLKDLENYRNFQAKVKQLSSVEYGSGEELWKTFANAVALATGDLRSPGLDINVDSRLGDYARAVSSAKITLRTFTALKQTLSFPAFMSDARPDDLMFAAANAKGSVEWALENLPGFAKRWQSRQVGDTRLMETDSDAKVKRNRRKKALVRAGLTPNASVDCLTVAIGSRGVYLTAKRRYLSYGYSEEQAERKALQDAAISYNSSQQSSEGAFTSKQQMDRSMLSIATTVFRNASMGYERRFTTGLRNLNNMRKAGYREEVIENTKKQMMEEGLTEEQAQRAAERVYNRMKWHSMMDVANYGFLLPFFWNLGPALIYIIGGDDKDEKMSLLTDCARHALFGPVEGLTFGGLTSELANHFLGSMAGEGKSLRESIQALGHRSMNPLPAYADMQKIWQEFGSKDVWRGVTDIANLLVQSTTAVNPETITDMGVAILDACKGDMGAAKEAAFLFMRLNNMPQSQVDKIFMDEVGLSAGEAKQLSAGDLAKRYARYKAWKSAPAAAGVLNLVDESAEQEREEKYVKQFGDRIQEKLVDRDVEWLEKAYDRSDDFMKDLIGKAIKKKLPELDDDQLTHLYDTTKNPETKKAARSILDKRIDPATQDPYKSADEDYMKVYNSIKLGNDMEEDILLAKAEKEAEKKGQKTLAKKIHGDRTKLTKRYRKKLKGNEGDAKVMDDMRKARGKLIDKYVDN